MARGFDATPDIEATVVVNVADDDVVHGLHVSPDIDTVVYTLAGVEGPHGWGRREESWRVIDELARFPGADTSFRLGDLDLAVNLFRTGLLRDGVPLSDITQRVATAFGLGSAVLPATDDRVRTEVLTDAGWFDFQTYFVRRSHRDRVRSVRFVGLEQAAPAPGVLEAIADADAIVIAPSNPVLSVWPVLDIGGIRGAVAEKPTIGVSPLIGGRAVKGPAVESMEAYGLPPTVPGVISAYEGLLDALVVDRADAVDVGSQVELITYDILITDRAPARRLAERVIQWAR